VGWVTDAPWEPSAACHHLLQAARVKELEDAVHREMHGIVTLREGRAAQVRQ
jgi:hypothetical protein